MVLPPNGNLTAGSNTSKPIFFIVVCLSNLGYRISRVVALNKFRPKETRSMFSIGAHVSLNPCIKDFFLALDKSFWQEKK